MFLTVKPYLHVNCVLTVKLKLFEMELSFDIETVHTLNGFV